MNKHVGVVESHAAENGEGLHKVLVVFGERKIIERVD